MIGPNYWTTGIRIKWRDGRWGVWLNFYDDGFCEDPSSEGTLKIRYLQSDLPTAIKTLVKDATELGIEFRPDPPQVYLENDGQADLLPPNWPQIEGDIYAAAGVVSAYSKEKS